MESKIENRFFLYIFFLMFFISVIIVNYFKLAFQGYKEIIKEREIIQINKDKVRRGNIYDRNGKPFTQFSKVYQTSITTNYLSEDKLQEAATLLGEILKIDKEDLYKKLKKKNQVEIKKNTSLNEKNAIEEYKKEGKLNYVVLSPSDDRTYPEMHYLSLLLGFTGVDNKGLEGLEYSLNEYLSSNKKDKVESEEVLKGNDIYLTIDSFVQQKAEEILDTIQIENKPESSMLLVMNAKTGEVLAYAGRPDFDPNNYNNYTSNERRNRPSHMIYEPGSVFKIYTMASILELGGITPDFKVDTSKGYLNDKITIPIKDVTTRGVLSASEIIKYSSNVGISYSSDRVNDQDFYDMILKFGFYKKTDVELSGEEKGLIKSPKYWSARSKATISFGQELSVTAIQMITASTVFANDGFLLKPTIISKIVDQDGHIIKQSKRQEVRKVISKSTASLLLDYMYDASQDQGTGRRIAIPGINISIKTGTAQIASLKEKIERKDGVRTNYSELAYMSSTLVLFPREDPQISIYLVAEYPKGEHFYGGTILPPHVKDLINFLISYLDMPIFAKEEYTINSNIDVEIPQLPILDKIIPNYIGLPLKTVLSLYKKKDLNLIIKGEGRYIKEQNPEEGSAFKKGMQLTLTLG